MSYSGPRENIVKPKLGCAVDWSHPMCRNLIAWWLCTDGNGTRVTDIARGRHAAFTNMSGGTDWVASDRGGGVDLDGTDDNLNITDDSVFSFGDGAGNDRPFSIVIRCKLRSITALQALVSKWVTTGREWLSYLSASVLYFELYNSGANIGRTAPLNSTAHLDRYHTYIFTYPGTKISVDIRIYIDGIRVDNASSESNNYTTAGMSDTTTDVRIGSYGAANANPLNAVVDDVRIFGRALSQAEALQMTVSPYAGLYLPPSRRMFTPVVASTGQPFRQRGMLIPGFGIGKRFGAMH